MCFSRAVVIAIPLASSFIILSSIIFFISQGSCPDGYFPCSTDDKCVKQRNICDGYFDCPNGEDEEPLYCVLEKVPNNCTCTDYTVVVCTRLRLHSVPSDLSKSTTRIILAENNITLKEADFKNFSFHLIHLSRNNISTLPKTVFHGQKELQKLFLNQNSLTNLPKETFFGLEELTWLLIQNNQLSELNFEEWNLKSLTWLDLSHNKLALKNKTFPPLPWLSLLYLDWNLIEEISEQTFLNLPSLKDLSLGWNRIKKIDPAAFSAQQYLQELNLRNNELKYLSEKIFCYTRNLTKLNLGGNILLVIVHNLFSSLTHLKSLDLQDIDIENINAKMFSVLYNLDFAYFKRFRYCTYAPHVPKCFPFSDGSSSASDLLMSAFLRITLWLVAVFTLVANGLVLWHRLFSSAFASPLNSFITSLAVSDLLMGVYLIVIGSEDLMLKGNYVVNARKWMSSWLCTSAGIIAMLSSEVSILMLLLISVERFILISTPLGEQKSLQPRVALMSLSIVWVFSLVISLLPVVQWRDALTFYGSNSFCFPLHIEDPYLIGWQYSAFVFLGINSFGIIGIALLYSGLFLSIYKTRHATTLSVKDSEFALKFFFIVITNACCWVPIILFKILAFMDVSFSGDLYGWLAVFVLPINSAINPILYTFSIPRYRTPIHPGEPINDNKPKLKRRFSRAISLNNKPSPVYEPPKTSEEQI